MEELELRKQILEACDFLVYQGLIARTWGNVSARLNDKQFIITPSGLAYDQTTVDDLVIVNIDDCSYDENQRKPSSEKGMHAQAYKARSDVNFIVHTHQHYASAICADESSITISDGTFVPCANYGLPGTKTLKNNCAKVFNDFKNTNMFLMAKHGTVIFGENKDAALNNAIRLEEECKVLFDKRVKEFVVPEKMEAYLDDYAQMFPLDKNEDKEAAEIVKNKNAAAQLYAVNAKPLAFLDAKLQHAVYKLKYSKLKDK